MTIKHIAMVLEAEGLDGPEKLLLIAYCNRTDDHGYCWPGQQRLADDCGTSTATVKRVKKRLIDKKLIASMRRVDPRTGEPISNLTRVNLELLAAMRRKRTEYDDNVVEKLTFGDDVPVPTKKKKQAPKRTARRADLLTAQDEPDPVDNTEPPFDLLMAQDEPDPGLKMSPTPVQDEPDLGVNLSPTWGQDEPLTVSDPPENPHGTVRPSVGSTRILQTEGRTDGEMAPQQQEVPRTEGVRFLQELGNQHPRLMITGKPLRDQGTVVDELFARGWKDEVLWELLTRPLPEPLRKDVSAVIAKRLRDALDSPLPGPRRAAESEETPTPPRYTADSDPVVRRRYECEGRAGLCGVPVEAKGDLCPACSRVPELAL
ncbi:helix-turn-helix domain-containing protein [Streptomyces sp. NPDC085937]|uniref:helix-turn-helix domain-containing protein n=1 Tax=Streptomyces sp. NPDC085937 TaxID=3365742 RepID=UPI0037D18C55